ncbi:MAG: hypothetical protein V1798_05930 [Pseudomonadota bacterium]
MVAQPSTGLAAPGVRLTDRVLKMYQAPVAAYCRQSEGAIGTSVERTIDLANMPLTPSQRTAFDRLLKVNGLLSIRRFMRTAGPYVRHVHSTSASEIHLEIRAPGTEPVMARFLVDSQGRIGDFAVNSFRIARNVDASLAWYMRRDGPGRTLERLEGALVREYGSDVRECLESLSLE